MKVPSLLDGFCNAGSDPTWKMNLTIQKSTKNYCPTVVRYLGSGLHVECCGGERVQVTNSRCHHAQRLQLLLKPSWKVKKFL